MNANDNKILIPFLRNLADSFESNTLLPNQVQKIGEFFMSYQHNEQVVSNNDNEDLSRDEMLKFFILGWYIYKHLLNNSEEE